MPQPIPTVAKLNTLYNILKIHITNKCWLKHFFSLTIVTSTVHTSSKRVFFLQKIKTFIQHHKDIMLQKIYLPVKFSDKYKNSALSSQELNYILKYIKR